MKPDSPLRPPLKPVIPGKSGPARMFCLDCDHRWDLELPFPLHTETFIAMIQVQSCPKCESARVIAKL